MLLFFDFRVGRTARAGNVGLAFSMVLRIQVCHWCKIHLKRKHREESKEDKDHTNFHLLQSAEFCTWKFLFSYSLTRERVPKCAHFLAERQWGFSTPVKGRYFHFFFYYICFVAQERRFLRMLKDAGIPDIKKHLVKGKLLTPLVQQYEEALSKLEKTVKVTGTGKKILKIKLQLTRFIATHDKHKYQSPETSLTELFLYQYEGSFFGCIRIEVLRKGWEKKVFC